jgi:hypothetical protein
MTRSMGPFKLDNPWARIGWLTVTGLVAVAAVLGFGVLGREQQNGRPPRFMGRNLQRPGCCGRSSDIRLSVEPICFWLVLGKPYHPFPLLRCVRDRPTPRHGDPPQCRVRRFAERDQNAGRDQG